MLSRPFPKWLWSKSIDHVQNNDDKTSPVTKLFFVHSALHRLDLDCCTSHTVRELLMHRKHMPSKLATDRRTYEEPDVVCCAGVKVVILAGKEKSEVL